MSSNQQHEQRAKQIAELVRAMTEGCVDGGMLTPHGLVLGEPNWYK